MSMHSTSEREVLAESGNGFVSRCTCCLEYNVVYKTVLLVFDEEAMLRFFEWVTSYRYSRENYHPLPHGSHHIYSSPHSNLFLVYSKDELDELAVLFAEVQIVLQVRKLVRGFDQ